MHRALPRLAIALIAATAFTIVYVPAAIATKEGMIAADQVSQANYYDIMNLYLFTHEGNNRGRLGPDLAPARDNIRSLMESYGLIVTLEEFTYLGNTYQNVIGTKPGDVYPYEQYIIGAHYDSVSNPGADDNASGVALVLETARIVSQYDSDYTIKFIAFSMEESGLIGSQRYLDNHVGDNILGMVSADMVAYDPGTDHAMIYGRTASNPIKNTLAAAIAEYGNGLTYTIGGDEPYSDHAPFEADGKQACLLIEGEVWDNPYYHKQTDNFENADNLNFPYAVKMTRSIVGWLVDQAVVRVPVPRLEVTLPSPLPAYVSPANGAELECVATGFLGVEPAADAALLHYNMGTGWRNISMTEIAAGRYVVTLPGTNCGEPVQYYFSVQAVDGDVYTNPIDAPADYYEAISADGRRTVLDFPLTANPGWSMEGQWAFGYPTGNGGSLHGGPDPSAGKTGPYVLGYNLHGDYPPLMPETHLTAGPFDCSGTFGVHLKFWRWLGVEDPLFDHAYIRIRADGGDWVTIWENETEIADTDWVEMHFDISDIADDREAVDIRWTMGETDSGWEYCGWNIDDVSLTAYDCIAACPGESGDLDGNGLIDGRDIQMFIEAVFGSYEPCADVADADGRIDEDDIQAMVSMLLGSP